MTVMMDVASLVDDLKQFCDERELDYRDPSGCEAYCLAYRSLAFLLPPAGDLRRLAERYSECHEGWAVEARLECEGYDETYRIR